MKNTIKSVLILSVVLLVSGCSSSSPVKNLDEFAQCLTDTGAIFYGTNSCAYCLKQKELFGDSLSKITFVDCIAKPDQCTLAGVKGVPYRYINYATRLEGLQSLEDLAKATSCKLVK